MNRMEYKDLSAATPSLEVWGDPAKYEAFVKELDGWKEEAKLASMEKHPDTFDTAEEPIIEDAYQETLHRARESGYRAKEYFLKRLEIIRFQRSEQTLPAPLETASSFSTPVPDEASPTPVVHDEEMQTPQTFSSENHTVDPLPSVPSETELPDRLKKFAGVAERMREARERNVSLPSSKIAETPVPERPKGFDALADFVPERRFADLPVSREVDIIGHPSVVVPEVSPTIETPAPSSDAHAPADVPTVPLREEGSATLSSVEERVKRSIEDGSFDLTLATGPQLEALLQHPDHAIVLRAQKEIDARTTRGLMSRDVPPPQETLAVPVPSVSEPELPINEVSEPEQERSPVTREMILETLRLGRMIPSRFLKKFKDDAEIQELLRQVEGTPAPAPEVPVVGGIPRVIPDETAVATARAEHDASVAIVHGTSFSEMHTPLTPRGDAFVESPDISAHEDIPAPVVPERPGTWEEMSLEERSALTKDCIARYPAGSPYRVVVPSGLRELWNLLSISDDGIVLFEHHTNETDQQFKRVGLLEFIELNPFGSPDRSDLTAEEKPATPEEVAPVAEAKEHTTSANETDRVSVLAEMRARWNAMSPDDQAVFTGECQFLFQPGREYVVQRTNGAKEFWTLVAVGTDGMADMTNKEHTLEKRVPLQELRDLNVEKGTIHDVLHVPEVTDVPEDHPEQGSPESKVETHTDAETFVVERFKDSFGLEPEQLMAMPEFAALSEGQQLLVHHELNNFAVSQIKAGAIQNYRDRFQSLRGPLSDLEKKLIAHEGMFGGLARLTVGIAQLRNKESWQKVGMSIFKRKFIAQEEKALAGRFASGDIDTSAYVRELALEAKEGPDAIIEDGSVRLQFLKPEDLGTLPENEATAVRVFNEWAGAFATLPHRFKERGATEDEQAMYRKAETGYRDALDQVLALLEVKGDAASALLDVNELDRRITFTQFFNAHPEAAEQLANIKDQNVWTSAAKDLLQTRGTLFALGGSVRTVAAAAAAQVFATGAIFVAAPLAGAATGAYMGKKRAESDLAERELLAKQGVTDESAEANNIVDAGSRTHESGRTLAGLSGKLNALLLEIEGTDDKEITVTPLVRQAPEADGSRGEILTVTPLGESSGAEHELFSNSRALERNKKADLLAQLEHRVAYTQTKLDQGMVNFGDKDERIQNQYTLLRAIAKAKALLLVEGEKGLSDTPTDALTGEAYDASWRKDTRTKEERLSDMLALREQHISEAQQAYVKRTIKQAALYGAGFAFAGAVVADLVHGVITPGGSVIGQAAEKLHESGTPQGAEGVAALTGAGASGEQTVAQTIREGWNSATVQKSLGDPTFTRDYVNGMTTFTNRSPEVGISDTELNALLATEDSGRSAAHQALVEAMRNTPTKLSDEAVAKIMMEHNIPSSLQDHVTPVVPLPRVDAAPSAPETLAVYQVKSGDNLSAIMRQHIPALKGLTPAQQENVIQNFLRKLSHEDLQRMGFADADRLAVGQQLDLRATNEILLSKNIQGEGLVAHAVGGTPSAASESVSVPAPYTSSQISAVEHAMLGQKNTTGAPEELLAGQRLTDGKAYVEYMNATDVVQKQKIAETMGLSMKEMDARIAGVLSKETGVPVGAQAVAPAAARPPVMEGMMDRPRATALAGEYILKDMTDPRTGKLSPLWVESKGVNADFLMTAKESHVDAVLWKKMLEIRRYTTAQGLDEAHKITPQRQETLEEFLRRAHAERILQDGDRASRGVAAPSPRINEAVPPPPAPRATVPAFEPSRLARPDPASEIVNTPRAVPQSAPTAPAAGYQYRSMTNTPPNTGVAGAVVQENTTAAPSVEMPPSGGYQYRRLP